MIDLETLANQSTTPSATNPSTDGIGEVTAGGKPNDGKLSGNSDFWGSVIGGVTDIIGQFNYKAQKNQVDVAQANAAAAQANLAASKENNKPKGNTLLYVGIGVAALILIIVLVKPKKQTA